MDESFVIAVLLSTLCHALATPLLSAASTLGVLGQNPHAVLCRFNVADDISKFHQLALYVGSREADSQLLTLTAAQPRPRWADTRLGRSVRRRAVLAGSLPRQFAGLVFRTTRTSDHGVVFLCRLLVNGQEGVQVGATEFTTVRVKAPGDVVRLTVTPHVLTQVQAESEVSVTFTCYDTTGDTGLLVQEMLLSRLTPNEDPPDNNNNDNNNNNNSLVAGYHPALGAFSYDGRGRASYNETRGLIYRLKNVTCLDSGHYTCNTVLQVPIGDQGARPALIRAADLARLDVKVDMRPVTVSTYPPNPELYPGSNITIICTDAAPNHVNQVLLIWHFRETPRSSWRPTSAPPGAPSPQPRPQGQCQTIWRDDLTHVIVEQDHRRQYRCYPRRDGVDFLQDAELFMFRLSDDHAGIGDVVEDGVEDGVGVTGVVDEVTGATRVTDPSLSLSGSQSVRERGRRTDTRRRTDVITVSSLLAGVAVFSVLSFLVIYLAWRRHSRGGEIKQGDQTVEVSSSDTQAASTQTDASSPDSTVSSS